MNFLFSKNNLFVIDFYLYVHIREKYSLKRSIFFFTEKDFFIKRATAFAIALKNKLIFIREFFLLQVPYGNQH